MKVNLWLVQVYNPKEQAKFNILNLVGVNQNGNNKLTLYKYFIKIVM